MRHLPYSELEELYARSLRAHAGGWEMALIAEYSRNLCDELGLKEIPHVTPLVLSELAKRALDARSDLQKDIDEVLALQDSLPEPEAKRFPDKSDLFNKVFKDTPEPVVEPVVEVQPEAKPKPEVEAPAVDVVLDFVTEPLKAAEPEEAMGAMGAMGQLVAEMAESFGSEDPTAVEAVEPSPAPEVKPEVKEEAPAAADKKAAKAGKKGAAK